MALQTWNCVRHYATIANSGNYIEPLYYTKILDHNGNVLIEKTSAGRSVIKESTAWLLTSAMEDVVDTGYRYSLPAG